MNEQDDATDLGVYHVPEQDETAIIKTPSGQSIKELISSDCIRNKHKLRCKPEKSKKWDYVTLCFSELINLLIHLELECGFCDPGVIFKVYAFNKSKKFLELQEYDKVVIDYFGSTSNDIRVGFKADVKTLLLNKYLNNDIIKIICSY